MRFRLRLDFGVGRKSSYESNATGARLKGCKETRVESRAMGREIQVRSHPSLIEHWRHLIEIVAFAGAAVWAIYVFIYQERIKPAASPIEVERTVHLRHDALRNQRELVTVQIDMKNIGSRSASPAALIANVYGIRYSDRGADHLESPLPDLLELNRSLQHDSPRLVYSYSNIWLPIGGTRHVVIDPTASESSAFVFAVPKDRYDMLSVQTCLCYTAASEHRRWPMQRERRFDGSFWLDYVKGVDYSGLTCVKRVTGSYFAI